MRFIHNGPWIPDDLLLARDAGDVLFFCGAGVSRAEAGLPDFANLARDVLNTLGSASGSPARLLFDAATATALGQIAVDRIFGMLEREFEAAEVRAAVALALKPADQCGLGAHRTLLDLSLTRGGVRRLVTTNFDRLFEDCAPEIASANPPKLPDPDRASDFHGIVHLHGVVDAAYKGACDDTFVLSSADFGHAYLSDGWATRYIQALLRRYRIVFVGYSADDPPVQYLLEALTRSDRPAHALYAFQSGDEGHAARQWEHKGVKPITYGEDHAALWSTLQAWAERARDVDRWYEGVIEGAARGPHSMRPHERGVVAHLAATSIGARKIANSKTVLPADWLFVFDRNGRYADGLRISETEGDRLDPFDAFGLDGDPPPPPPDPENIYARRIVPEYVWDAMLTTADDHTGLPATSIAPFRLQTGSVPALPPRLMDLGRWLCRIADRPATLWWAAKRSPLHPDIQIDIERSLRNAQAQYSVAMRSGWRLLLRSWKRRRINPDTERYTIERDATLEGWTAAVVREAVALYEPYLKVEASYRGSPPNESAGLTVRDILRAEVEYPRPHEPFSLPDESLALAVELFRQQLENALHSEREIHSLTSLYLDTLSADDGGIAAEDHHGITGHLRTFAGMMLRLAVFDPDSARREVARWSDNEPVFTLLRIWAAGRTELTTPADAADSFVALDDESFWRTANERDLMFAMRNRWGEIPSVAINALEDRLCQGTIPFGNENPDKAIIVAHMRLDRIQWLANQGISLSTARQTDIVALRVTAPDWTEESARDVAQPMVRPVRGMETDNSSADLEKLAVPDILEKAKEIEGFRFNIGVMRQPFNGLVQTRPVRALRALTDACRKSKFEAWAWRTLLHAEGDLQMSPRLLCVTSYRLARLPSSQLHELADATVSWLRSRFQRLLSTNPEALDALWAALLAVLKGHVASGQLYRSNRNWAEQSANSPVGHMIDLWFSHPSAKAGTANSGMPAGWLARLEAMLQLPGEYGLHAALVIASRTPWLFHVAPDWTTQNLLPLASGSANDVKAFWSGYLWRPNMPQPTLFRRLRTPLLELASRPELRREHAGVLANILLVVWAHDGDAGHSEEHISDAELREILIRAGDELQIQVLWHLKHFAAMPETSFPTAVRRFLASVWPRQKALRTARLSEKLVELVVSLPERFAELMPLVAPRLVVIKGQSTVLYETHRNANLLQSAPVSVLDLLSAILDDDPNEWPLGTVDLLRQLQNVELARGDPRMRELVMRSQSRQPWL